MVSRTRKSHKKSYFLVLYFLYRKMSCCSSAPGVNPKLIASIRDKLSHLVVIFPSLYFAVILSSVGEVVSFENSKVANPEKLLVAIAAVKRAAALFANSLQQTECPVMHIRGNNTLFSCFDLESSHILVLCSEMHSVALESFNVSEAENAMESEIDSLNLLLRSLIAESR